MKKFAIFLKKTLTNKGYYPRLIFDETTNTCSIMKNKNVIIPLGGDGSETDLSNYYDKDETNALLDDKANTADVYTKSEVDTELSTKADTSALPDMDLYYTKTETDSALGNKVNTSALNSYYTKTEVDSALSGKADTSALPNMSLYYTKSEVDDEIDGINIPTKTSDLVNDSDFIDSSALNDYYTKSEVDDEIDGLDNSLSVVAKTGDYNDLSNKPTLFDGDYNSLSNKPFIPTDIDDLTDNDNLLFDGDYNSLSNKPDLSVYATKTYVDDEIDGLDIPTKTSDLTNDSGFITNTTLNDYYTKSEVNAELSAKANTADVYTKSEVYTKTEVEALLLVLENKITDLEDRIAALEPPVEEE